MPAAAGCRDAPSGRPPAARNPGPPGAPPPPARARTHRAGGPGCRGARGARPQGPGAGCRLSLAASAARLRGAAPTPGPRRVPMSPVPAAAGAPWPAAAAPHRPGACLPQAVAGGGVGCISPGYIAAPGLRGGVGNAEPAGLPAPHVREGGGARPRGGERRAGVGPAGAPAPRTPAPRAPQPGIPASCTSGLRTRHPSARLCPPSRQPRRPPGPSAPRHLGTPDRLRAAPRAPFRALPRSRLRAPRPRARQDPLPGSPGHPARCRRSPVRASPQGQALCGAPAPQSCTWERGGKGPETVPRAPQRPPHLTQGSRDTGAGRAAGQPRCPAEASSFSSHPTPGWPAHAPHDAVSPPPPPPVHGSRAVSPSSAEEPGGSRGGFKAPLPGCFGLLPLLSPGHPRRYVARGTGVLMMPRALAPRCQVEMGEQGADWGLPDNLFAWI